MNENPTHSAGHAPLFTLSDVFDLAPANGSAPPETLPQSLENGRVRDLLALAEEDFRVTPIARRLSQINRYAGASRWPYSVAVHSLFVSRLLEIQGYPEIAYEGLMHDATESFIGDLISPIKHLPGMALYNEIESAIRAQLVEPLGLSLRDCAEVHHADERAYQLECKFHRGKFPSLAHTSFKPGPISIQEHEAGLFYCGQEFYWRDGARLFVEAFKRLAPAAVQRRCL